MFAIARNISATLRLLSKPMSWAFVPIVSLILLRRNMPRPGKELAMLDRVITLGNLRARFNIALDIGSSGFSGNRVCALPESHPGTGRT